MASLVQNGESHPTRASSLEPKEVRRRRKWKLQQQAQDSASLTQGHQPGGQQYSSDSHERSEHKPKNKREHCNHCSRPSSVCLCSFFPDPRVKSRVHVVVLMHPKELDRKVTTVRLAELSLELCDVLVGRDLSAFLGTGLCPALDEALSKSAMTDNNAKEEDSRASSPENNRRTCVLFPGEGAFDLSSVRASGCGSRSGEPYLKERDSSERGSSSTATQSTVSASSNGNSNVNCKALADAPSFFGPTRYLVVFDGTWRFAREMFERNRHLLQHCTQVQFSRPFGMGTDGASEFVTRVEPADMCASTLEAIVAALAVLDPNIECRKDDLLRPFRQMMRIQLAKKKGSRRQSQTSSATTIITTEAETNKRGAAAASSRIEATAPYVSPAVSPALQQLRPPCTPASTVEEISADVPPAEKNTICWEASFCSSAARAREEDAVSSLAPGMERVSLDSPVVDAKPKAHVQAAVPYRQRPWAVLSVPHPQTSALLEF